MACVRENRNTYAVVVVKLERRRCRGGPRLSWDDNLNMYLRKQDGWLWTEWRWVLIKKDFAPQIKIGT